MAEPHSTATRPTRAYVIHPDLGDRRGQRRSPDLALEEAVALARALPAIEVVGATVAKLRNPSPGMLFSSGKLAELGAEIAAVDTELVLIDTRFATPAILHWHSAPWGVVSLTESEGPLDQVEPAERLAPLQAMKTRAARFSMTGPWTEPRCTHTR